MKKSLLLLMIIPMIGFGQTAKEYFNKALNYAESEKYWLAIDNYTKCIKLKPDDTNLATAYYNRGLSYGKLGNYEDEIADYTRVIRIDPDYASAYKNRGIVKEKVGLPYCSDYKRACDLGKEECCEWYYKQCR